MRKDIHIFKIIFTLWGISILLYELSVIGENIKYISSNHGYTRLMMLFIIIGIFLEFYIFKLHDKKWKKEKQAFIIFLIALLVRIVFLPFAQYVPSNDFRNYFEGACHFANNGFAAGAYSALMSYHIPEFAGQSIINGFFLSIFSPTLLGMQILNSIYTSGICLFIYLFGEKININVAIMGGILYTFYPGSILSTQITTNHHGATFFLLLGIYLFETMINNTYRNKRNKIFMCIFCSICFSISNFYHPSIIIVICALLVTTFIKELDHICYLGKTYLSVFLKEVKEFNNRILLTVIVIITYEIISVCSLTILKNINYIEDSEMSIPIGKIVVGLNQETNGGYCESDYTYIDSLPKDEKIKEGIKIIEERLKDPKKVLILMAKKIKIAWYEQDNYRWFYTAGILEELEQKINKTSDITLKDNYEKCILTINETIEDVSQIDTLYINLLWVLALIGIYTTIKEGEKATFIYSLLFVPIGWMLFITFTEMQARYRYQGMPAVVLLAALGTDYIIKKSIKNYSL